MRHLRFGLLAVALLLPFVTGCSRLEGMATRYRAERMGREAQREETKLRIGKAAPDSATMLKIRAEYQKLRLTFRPPFVKGSGKAVEQLRQDIARQVGVAELTASRTALYAHRPDLALESARWVASIAEADTGLQRESDVAAIMALRGLRRYDEAIAAMRTMLDRYPPIAPPTPDQEDQILSIPDAIVELRTDAGDTAGAERERAYAATYFRRILASHPAPILEAQVRARLIRTLLETGDANAALAEVRVLHQIVSATPALRSFEPELLYTEARIRAMQKSYKEALALYAAVVRTYPASPFVARALLDAAVIAERTNDDAGAIARYRAILDRPKPDPGVAPVAAYRMAMVKDQTGNWEEAKQILESIPVKYPRSRAGVEAPIAIVDHYNRSHQQDAAKAALLKAVETYRTMLAQDSGSVYATVYRWNILRGCTTLKRWNDALETVDQMATLDRGAPITVEALFQGAQIARANGDKPRSNKYLQRIALEYPESPRGAQVRELLKQSAGTGAPLQKK